MGTTLTGTTPQDTYDSLIKVTDNGPLSGTAKYLSDGLGNDSVLALSTAQVGVGVIPAANVGNLQVGGTANASIFSQQGTDTVRAGVRASGRVGIVFDSSNATYTNRMWYLDSVGANGTLTIGRQGLDVMTFANAGNVGIGTSSPVRTLQVNVGSAATSAVRITNSSTGSGANDGFEVAIDSVGNAYVAQKENLPLIFLTNDTEVGRFLAGGGLTFNGDTAAANALDDYEEGTWTPVLRGAGTAGTYEQATTYATYTKIGRQVSVNAYILFAASVTGGGTSYAQITGLPFSKSANQQIAATAKFNLVNFGATTAYVTCEFIGTGSTPTIYFAEVIDNALPADLPISAFGNNSQIQVSLTYFV